MAFTGIERKPFRSTVSVREWKNEVGGVRRAQILRVVIRSLSLFYVKWKSSGASYLARE